jgi:anti-anti-sigma factor
MQSMTYIWDEDNDVSDNQLQYAAGSVHENVLVIEIAVQQIRDPDTVYALRDEMLSLIDSAGTNHLVLDFQRVTFVGSVAFLAFLAVRRRLKDGRIVICNLSDSIRLVFEICRLISKDASSTAAFEVEQSRDAALARFAGA